MFQFNFLAGLSLISQLTQVTEASIFLDELEPRAFKKDEVLDIYIGDVYSRNSMEKSKFPYDLFCGTPKGKVYNSYDEITTDKWVDDLFSTEM